MSKKHCRQRGVQYVYRMVLYKESVPFEAQLEILQTEEYKYFKKMVLSLKYQHGNVIYYQGVYLNYRTTKTANPAILKMATTTTEHIQLK